VHKASKYFQLQTGKQPFFRQCFSR